MDILKKFTEKEIQVIDYIKKASIKANLKTYIVGGAIRDCILNSKINDIDICVEGEPKKIIDNLQGLKEHTYYDKFHTATLNFKNNIQIDLIGCRKEYYEYDGALPTVILSNITEDLKRRDFTINSLAYDILEDKIIDLFNGIKHIQEGKIIKIHKNSYMEDGTRIFRAIKYATRYNFKIEDENEIAGNIKIGALKHISNHRIVSEIYGICKELNWIQAIKQCNSYDLLNINTKLLGIKNILIDYSNIYARILNIIYATKDKTTQNIFIDNSFIDKELKKSIENYVLNKEEIYINLLNAKNNNEIYKILNKTYPWERVLLAWNLKLKYKIYNYEKNLKDVKLNITGDYIKKFNIQQGKQIGFILGYIKDLKINLGTLDEEKFFIENIGEIENAIKHKNT